MKIALHLRVQLAKPCAFSVASPNVAPYDKGWEMHYTYKIGLGAEESSGLSVVSHSTVIVAATIGDAIEKAKDQLAKSAWWENANRIVLSDDSGMIVWSYDLPHSRP